MTALPDLSASDMATLRRMCNLADDDATYTDTVLNAYAQKYAVLDKLGQEPLYIQSLSSISAPTWTLNPYWTPTYDLSATAADVLQECAAAFMTSFDWAADNASYKTSQKYQMFMQQARYYRSRRMPKSFDLAVSVGYLNELEYVINNDS